LGGDAYLFGGGPYPFVGAFAPLGGGSPRQVEASERLGRASAQAVRHLTNVSQSLKSSVNLSAPSSLKAQR
jgi:hypothetical protein